MTTTTTPQAQPARQWAIVEIFGRTTIAGAISEHTMGSESLLRVDVPEVRYTDESYVEGKLQLVERTIPAHTKLLGVRAIYSIAYVDEAAAILQAHDIKHEPVTPWRLRDALRDLPAHERHELLTAASGGDERPF
ncbi:hypothetical protein [Rubrivivax sp. JA1026]|uniref:hypothetical protein n=1 Tax=Rubrivivax sp. JA1026 TaxID=2710888 RepID=UPI0013E947CA|nr:hypothetical protein [Rubrivivax sp. JA1026]